MWLWDGRASSEGKLGTGSQLSSSPASVSLGCLSLSQRAATLALESQLQRLWPVPGVSSSPRLSPAHPDASSALDVGRAPGAPARASCPRSSLRLTGSTSPLPGQATCHRSARRPESAPLPATQPLGLGQHSLPTVLVTPLLAPCPPARPAGLLLLSLDQRAAAFPGHPRPGLANASSRENTAGSS